MHEELVDGYGRIHTDLRISVTDRCDFRCTYCMPTEEMVWLPRAELLNFEEIVRVAAIAVGCGVNAIRLTGGEPLVRANLPDLVASLASLTRADGSPIEVSLTTNGSRLAQLAPALRSAGLARVNISIDTLRRDRFRELTQRDQLQRVIEGIRSAVRHGFAPVKLNAVVMRGVNDDELSDLVEFALAEGAVMRFIEFMPLDGDRQWSRDRVVPRAEMLRLIAQRFAFQPLDRDQEPAERFLLSQGSEFGIIPTVTQPFCGTCDRLRLSAEGGLRNCLFANEETDLRAILRGGGSDEEIVAADIGLCFGPDSLAEARNRVYTFATAGRTRRPRWSG